MKQLALSELRLIAEKTRLVKVPVEQFKVQRSKFKENSGTLNLKPGTIVEVLERVPWRVWYVAASNGDMILGEECVTLAVELDGPGAYPTRLVQFIRSGQTRKLRDCCILQADDRELVI